MLLSTDPEAIRDAVRDFTQAELWPHAPRWDREHTFPKEAHAGLAALGAYGICVPEEELLRIQLPFGESRTQRRQAERCRQTEIGQ
jgi:alkylation response protein AidB-like acyl-CoA dehydrogenase